MEGLDDRREEESEYAPRDFADWREIPSEALERKEVRQRLAEALGTLDRKYREVFMLRDMETFEHSGDSRGVGHHGCFGEDAAVAGAADAARSAGCRMGARLVQPVAIREGGPSHGRELRAGVARDFELR